MQALDVNISDPLKLALHPIMIRLCVILMLRCIVRALKEVFFTLDWREIICTRKGW